MGGSTSAAVGAAVAWIVAGGGSIPELNQVSIEQDLADAAKVFAAVSRPRSEAGVLLFASGVGDRTVQVAGRPPPLRAADPDQTALAALFDPRGGRGATYRATQLSPDGPATADELLSRIDTALAGGPGQGQGRPLLVYIAGHGQMGASPSENWVDLWEESALTPPVLAAALEQRSGHRQVRFVVTTCHSGGFGELAFAAADEAAGAAVTDRCGLFAAPWDLPASGCDPHPDRAAHQGYARYFLPALASGATLLQAHTAVRLQSPAPDVPTTTSERWLRHAAPKEGRPKPYSLPEEDQVVEALSKRLRTGPTEAAAALDLLERSMEGLNTARRDAQSAEDAAWRQASASVLARWPVLNDPWHPDFAPTLQADRHEIRRQLATHPAIHDWQEARRRLDDLDVRIWTQRDRAAPLERLARADETRRLAARLHAQGGPDWAHFLRLRACESSRP